MSPRLRSHIASNPGDVYRTTHSGFRVGRILKPLTVEVNMIEAETAIGMPYFARLNRRWAPTQLHLCDVVLSVQPMRFEIGVYLRNQNRPPMR